MKSPFRITPDPDTPMLNAAQETLERATRFAELGIEATLGRREDYPQPFARLRAVIAAAIEEDREASAQIADDFHGGCPDVCSVKFWSKKIAKLIRARAAA